MINQKDFLLKFEDLCGVKKPVWINSQDTFAVGYESLVRARDLTVEHSIGRLRLTQDNSDVVEIIQDEDNHEGLPFKEYMETKLVPTYNKLKSFGIPEDCIFTNVTGRGVHLHVFLANLPDNIDVDEILIKTSSDTADTCSKAPKHKFREFGAIASTKNGYTGYEPYPLGMKRDFSKFKKEPVYPNIKLFHVTEEFIVKVSCAKLDKIYKPQTRDAEVNYDMFGDFMKLYMCPAVKLLAKKAEIDHHLSHPHRFFLMSEFMMFGKDGIKHIHEIMKHCSDYSEYTTQYMIDNAQSSGYLPCGCKHAMEELRICPLDCKGSGGKSPISFATKIELEQIHKICEEEISLVTETGDIDYELVDIHLTKLLDTLWGGDLNWTFSVAPSGSAKSLLIRSLSWKTYSLDSFTDKTFVSGLVKKNKDGTTEPIAGIAHELHNNTLTIEDMSTLLSKRSDTRDEIFGFLRNAYKGYLEIGTGTLKHAQREPCRFGLLVGVTPIIDNYMQLLGQLGERFLKIRHCLDEDLASKKALEKVLQGKQSIDESFRKVRNAIYTFMTNLQTEIQPEVDEETKLKIRRLAFYTSRIRTGLLTDREGGLSGTIEYYTRLTTQFTRELIFLCWTRRHQKPTDDDIRTLARYAFDTPHATRTLLLVELYNKEKMSIEEASKALKTTRWKAKKVLDELEWIGIIQPEAGSAQSYEFTPKWKPLFEWVYKLGSRGWTRYILKRDSNLIANGTRHNNKPRITLNDLFTPKGVFF